MPNIHTPERQPSESQAQYRDRRAESKRIVSGTTKIVSGPKTSREVSRSRHTRAGTYGLGLRNQFKANRLIEIERKRMHPRDAAGAVTLVGPLVSFEGIKPSSRFLEMSASNDGHYTARRIWLGGVSAQRGY